MFHSYSVLLCVDDVFLMGYNIAITHIHYDNLLRVFFSEIWIRLHHLKIMPMIYPTRVLFLLGSSSQILTGWILVRVWFSRWNFVIFKTWLSTAAGLLWNIRLMPNIIKCYVTCFNFFTSAVIRLSIIFNWCCRRLNLVIPFDGWMHCELLPYSSSR